MNDWQLTGRVVVACNCDWGCPCNFNAMPSRGKCEGGWIWAIEQGHVRGVAVDGTSVALYADWPGAIHQGGGRAICFFDERANDAQRTALTSLLRGEVGGPWQIFSKTYELAAPQPARFEFEGAGYDTQIRIGDAVEVQLQPMRNPVTHAEIHPEIVLPEGLVLKGAKLAASRVFRVRRSLGYDHSGQYTAFGSFAYSAP